MPSPNPIKDHPVIAVLLLLLTVAATLVTMRKDLIISRPPTGLAPIVNGDHPSHYDAPPSAGTSNNQFNAPTVIGNGSSQFNAPTVVGNSNKQFNGPIGTINEAPLAQDPSTKQGAREALGRIGLRYDLEGFDDAVRAGQLDTIKLYLRGGQSPNSYMGFTFILDGAIANAPSQFGEILKLFQTESDEKLNFRTMSPVGTSLEDVLFADLSKNDVARNGQILIKAGASPDGVLKGLQAEKSALQNAFDSKSRRDQYEDSLGKFGITSTQDRLSIIERRIKYLEALKI